MSQNTRKLDVLGAVSDKIATQIWEMTDSTHYGYMNASHASFLGFDPVTAQQKSIYELLDKDIAEVCVAQNELAFEMKKPVVSEEWALNPLNERRLLKIVKVPTLDNLGNVLSLACSAEDITEQHLQFEQCYIKEQILEAIAQFSRKLFSDSKDAIKQGLATLGMSVKVDRVYYWENHYDKAQNAWLTSQRYEWVSTGIPAEINNPVLQNVPIDLVGDFITPLQNNRPFVAHIKDLDPTITRDSLAAQDIQSILVLPVFVEDEFSGFVGFDSCQRERQWTSLEISLLQMFTDLLSKALQQNRLQRALVTSRNNFSNFFGTIDDLLFVLDMEGFILDVNETVIRKTGYSKEELVGQSVLLMHPAELYQEAQRIVQEMILGTTGYCKLPIMNKMGQRFPVETRIYFGEWNGQNAIFGVSKDMTQLEFSLEKFSKVFEQDSLMIAIVDTKSGQHIDINKTFCNILGYSRDEVIGKSPFELSTFTSKEDEMIASNIFTSGENIDRMEAEIKDSLGRNHPIILSINSVIIGALSCVIVTMLDITDRKKMEIELRQYNEHLEQKVEEKVQDLSKSIWSNITALVSLTESRDDDTGGHLKRMSETCRLISTKLQNDTIYSSQIDGNFISNIEKACLLHDIGKVAIPDRILLKNDKLTSEEFDEMKKHTVIGAQTLESAYSQQKKSDLIQMGIDIALSHHERWDGLGYPNGLSGGQIPLAAQIVSICDVYDALRSSRSYKQAFTHEQSLFEIKNDIARRFNPVIANCFLACEKEIEQVYSSYVLST